MASKAIPWGDGSGDALTVTFSGNEGTSTLAVSSDANRTQVRRTITLRLYDGAGTLLAEVPVSQEAATRSYSGAYSRGYN